jgi:hypothetical protein
MSLILQSSGGGQITIQEPATASNFTQTLPAAAGTMMVSGNMPAFSAYQSSTQTPTSGVYTKVQFQNKSNSGLSWDTNNCYDNVTNYRFTPTVAGYYQINACVNFSPTAGISIIAIYRNGTEYKRSQQFNIVPATGGNAYGNNVSGLVYFNGTTDYAEIYVFMGSAVATSASTLTYFDGSMVRAA